MGLGVVGLETKSVVEEAHQFLRDGIRLIEGEFFDIIEDGGVGDDSDVEGVGDGSR